MTTTPPTPALGVNGRPLPIRPDCAADAGGSFVMTRTSERNELGVLVIGTGRAGVVLAPQSDGDICQWLGYARVLAGRYRVALFDWQMPQRENIGLATRVLRRAGVRRIVVAGASLGGAFALADAHALRPRVDGVMSFSGELTLRGFDGRRGIAAWHGPLLALGSAQDALFDASDARALAALHPGSETVVVVPGRAHGVDLLTGPAAPRVRAAADRFLGRVLG
ncbi:MAG: alpha/beta fold hydrolase [Actinomycetes bacterium]